MGAIPIGGLLKMEKEVEKQYNALKKKYSLPDFKDIDSEFDVSSIDQTTFLLRRICEKINEKIGNFIKILEELLQPEGSIKSLYELRYLDDNDKKNAYFLYKKLMIRSIDFLSLSLTSNEKAHAEFIKNKFNEWENIKEDLKPLLEKMKKSWEIETDIKEDLQYLG